ncbi:hypothetical protein PM082_011959 [Marasmius tenuissimus]|nr:hypothetical protein PM082_011959 [Marasmius tenuissimus]
MKDWIDSFKGELDCDDKERHLLLRLYSDYNPKIRAADPDTLVKQLEEKFGQRAMLKLSSPSDRGPGLRPRYEISGE